MLSRPREMTMGVDEMWMVHAAFVESRRENFIPSYSRQNARDFVWSSIAFRAGDFLIGSIIRFPRMRH